MSIVLDKKVLIGIGIGMIITASLMSSFQYSKNVSDSEIEERARNLGMHYEDECKVFFKGDEVSD